MLKTLRDFEVKNKRVLVRCDFNVPLDEKRNILDDFRIKETLPTIKHLLKERAKLILMSHLGRPRGRAAEELRLIPIQNRLTGYLDVSVAKTADCVGYETEKSAFKTRPGDILLLENLRFHAEEESNDENFAKDMARLGEIYINDAFGSSHRNHASIVGVPKYLPSGAGFLMEKEIKSLAKLTENPEKPLVVIIGGSKVETKAKLINIFSKTADFVFIGDLIEKEIKEKGISLDYPQKIVAPIDDIDGKDIGPETIKLFREKILSARTIFFNGVLGQIEKEEYSRGTEEILKAIIDSGAFSVVGGGDMTKVLNKLGLIDKFNHVSTGGGAMLEFLAGKKLPGIEALEK